MAGYTYEAYKGYDLGNDNFKCPKPWDISMYPNDEFETHTKKIEVPNSALSQVGHAWIILIHFLYTYISCGRYQ
jgi:hypothetical protein